MDSRLKAGTVIEKDNTQYFITRVEDGRLYGCLFNQTPDEDYLLDLEEYLIISYNLDIG